LKSPKLETFIYNPGQYLLEIPLCDVHLSKLCWDKEVDDDYDLEIAEGRFKGAISQIITDASLYKVDRIVFPIGQDFFNSDNDRGETRKGTAQSMDSRWQKMYFKGCEMNIWAIEHLRKIAPIDIMYIPGNHDYQYSYFMVSHLKAYFRNVPSVQVNDSPRGRKYYHYGNNLIGYSHGEEKKQNLDKIMQAEASELWGKTKHREFHLAHRHTEHVTEYPGFIIRRISSFTGNDEWHHTEGYVQQSKKAQAFLWCKDKGLRFIINVSFNKR
jgi:hypothetical protein